MWKGRLSDMAWEEAREQVIQSGLRLVQERLVARTWGNISCRVNEDTFVITPSGRSYRELEAQDLVPVDIRTLQWTGSVKPSSEKGLHAEIYKLDKEIGMVIHTHQVNASVVASVRREIPLMNRKMEQILGMSIPCAPYALPGTKKLKRGVAKALSLSGSKAVLLANHGAVCFGRTAEEAFLAALTLEEICEEFIRREFLRLTGETEGRVEERISHYLACRREN